MTERTPSTAFDAVREGMQLAIDGLTTMLEAGGPADLINIRSPLRYALREYDRAESSLRARLAAEVDALPGYFDPRYSGQFELRGHLDRAAVLRVIEGESRD